MIHLREEVICQHFESLTRLRAVDQQLTHRISAPAVDARSAHRAHSSPL